METYSCRHGLKTVGAPNFYLQNIVRASVVAPHYTNASPGNESPAYQLIYDILILQIPRD